MTCAFREHREDRSVSRFRFLIAAAALLVSSCASRSLDPGVGVGAEVASASFPACFAETANTNWIAGNEITTLINGDAFLTRMLEAVESAQVSITFETFAYVDGPMTRKFTEALARKAEAGIPVLMIVDAIGSQDIGKHNVERLRAAGVSYHAYRPFNPFRLAWSNNRTHRKILVVDGRLGFTGGAGFAYAWEGNAHTEDHWRDTQYEILGPVVAQLQQAFGENWRELTGQSLATPTYFPKLEKAGPYQAQFVMDSPRTRSNPIAHTVLHGINAARHSLILEQSYFVPSRTFRRAMIKAAQRGVRVELLVPSEKIDSPFCRYASQNYWEELIEAGVQLYQYTPTMMHGKLLIVDNRLSIIGSGNMDARSFFINDEVNLHVLSSRFAQEQEAMFRRDLQRAQRVTLDNLSEVLAPLPHRMLARFVAPQL